jgi:hypothetical protein
MFISTLHDCGMELKGCKRVVGILSVLDCIMYFPVRAVNEHEEICEETMFKRDRRFELVLLCLQFMTRNVCELLETCD